MCIIWKIKKYVHRTVRRVTKFNGKVLFKKIYWHEYRFTRKAEKWLWKRYLQAHE